MYRLYQSQNAEISPKIKIMLGVYAILLPSNEFEVLVFMGDFRIQFQLCLPFDCDGGFPQQVTDFRISCRLLWQSKITLAHSISAS